MSLITRGLAGILITRGLGDLKPAIIIVKGLVDRGGIATGLADRDGIVDALSDIIQRLDLMDRNQLADTIADYLEGIDGSQDRLIGLLEKFDMYDKVTQLADYADDILASLEASE